MTQLEDNTICILCYGCNRLLLEDFKGVKNCKGFLPAYEDWQEKFYQGLKNVKDKGGTYMACKHRKIKGNVDKCFVCGITGKVIDDYKCTNCMMRIEDTNSQFNELFGQIFGKGFGS